LLLGWIRLLRWILLQCGIRRLCRILLLRIGLLRILAVGVLGIPGPVLLGEQAAGREDEHEKRQAEQPGIARNRKAGMGIHVSSQ